MAISADGFDRAVALPPGLTISHIRNAIDYIEERAEELIDLYYEQANIFSGLIGILGVRALDSLSLTRGTSTPMSPSSAFRIYHWTEG